MLVTFWVLKCDKSREVKPLQSENILFMSVTFCVLKCDTSREVKRKQPLNIPPMSVTFWVLKCDTSREVRPEQPVNISPMFVTFWVLKRDTSREVKTAQPENISLMSFTSEVLRCSSPPIFLRTLQLKNHLAVVVGRKSRNEASNTTRVVVLFSSVHVLAHAGKVPSLFFLVSLMPHVVPVRVARWSS